MQSAERVLQEMFSHESPLSGKADAMRLRLTEVTVDYQAQFPGCGYIFSSQVLDIFSSLFTGLILEAVGI